MACCDSWIKIRLLLTNVLVAASGITFIIVIYGMYHLSFHQFYNLLDWTKLAPPLIIFSIGWALLFLSIYGSCGVVFQSSYALEKYGALLIIIFLIQITAGCISLLIKTTGEDYYYILNREFNLTNTSSSSREMMSMLQIEVQCCGVNGPLDHILSKNDNWATNLVESCCPKCNLTSYPCQINKKVMENCTIYETGCAQALYIYLTERGHLLGKIVILFAFVEFAAIVQSLLMAEKIKKLQKAIAAFWGKPQ